jgi:tartrate-resistant acid phosphatase type 5
LEEGEGKYQWRFVYGHHIMYSGGDYGDFGHQNMTDFENLFVKHKIDAYFCGHQHILQHLGLF